MEYTTSIDAMKIVENNKDLEYYINLLDKVVVRF